jgi:hypothetical protein
VQWKRPAATLVAAGLVENKESRFHQGHGGTTAATELGRTRPKRRTVARLRERGVRTNMAGIPT